MSIARVNRATPGNALRCQAGDARPVLRCFLVSTWSIIQLFEGLRIMSWPNYEVAPSDSVYALGVVSINYARFERTNVWVLAAVANMSELQASIICARTNAVDKVKLIETFISHTQWPPEALKSIEHYLKAMDILIKNRNVLIHSNMIRGTDNRAAIYNTTRQGKTNLFQATLKEIRQVADDLDAYFYYGLNLANKIASDIHFATVQSGMLVFHHWPEPLPLPVHIDPRQRPKPKKGA